MKTENNSQAAEHGHPILITVLVNEKPVTFTERRVTGLQIKETAIAQEVDIKLDFVLHIVRGPGHLQTVGDSEVVTLNDNLSFRATAPDDNS